MCDTFKLGLRFKVAFALNALIVLTLFATSYTSYQQSKQIAEDKVIELQKNQLQLLKNEIKSALNEHQNILMSLRDTPPIQEIIQALTLDQNIVKNNETLATWKYRLSTIFSAFLKNHSEYLQIRFIKNSGKELVRVERKTDNQVEVASEGELQNKATAQYVTETVKLPIGKVYYSNVSLNKEQNTIQQPHVPVLRIATPVYSSIGDAKHLS